MRLLRIVLVFVLALTAGCAGEPSRSDRAAAPPESTSALDRGPRAGESPVIEALVPKGEALFKGKGCTACHAYGRRLTGPDLKGVTRRRTAAWMEMQILHPEIMIKEDPIARAMFHQYSLQMANQGLKPDEAKAVIEYLKSLDHAAAAKGDLASAPPPFPSEYPEGASAGSARSTALRSLYSPSNSKCRRLVGDLRASTARFRGTATEGYSRGKGGGAPVEFASERAADMIVVFAGADFRKEFALRAFRNGAARVLVLTVARFEWRRVPNLGLPSDGGLLRLVEATPAPKRLFVLIVEGDRVEARAIDKGRWGTWSEAKAFASIIRERNARSILVCTSEFHTPRATQAVRRALAMLGDGADNDDPRRTLTALAAPEPVGSDLTDQRWWRSLHAWGTLLLEGVKRIVYAVGVPMRLDPIKRPD